MKIAEIADLLKVSKKTIYRKIDKLDLTSKGYVEKKGQTRIVDLEGVELIRSSLVKGHDKDTSNKIVTVEKVTKLEDHAIESYKNLLKEQKELYEKMLLEKVQVIEDKDRLIDDLRKDKDRLMQMQENNQVLLVREQERILLLEESVDKKGFWSKFKKN